jgi:hypothetical protein
MQGALTTSSAAVSALQSIGLPPFMAASWVPFPGQPVSGTGVPAGTTVLSVTDATDIVLSANATAGGSQVLTFGAEPVTLAEAQLHAVVENPDDLVLLAGYIIAARRYCENYLRSALITQTWALYLDSFPSAGGYYNRAIREIWPSMGSLPSGLGFYPGMVPNSTGVIDIPMPPLQKIVSVGYWNFQNTLQVVSPAAYIISPGTPARIQPTYSTVWPISRPTIDSVIVTFQCGYGPLESNIPESTKLAIKFLVATWYRNRESIAPGAMLRVPDTIESLLSVDDPGIYA